MAMSVINEHKLKERSQAFGPSSLPNTGTRSPESNSWIVFVVLGGVFLPVAAILFELTTRVCASIVDVVPTAFHLVMLCLVPVTNGLALWAYRRQNLKYAGAVVFMLGLSVGTSIIYSIKFIAVSPFMLLLIVVFGFGLLGLAPYFALASSIICAKKLNRLPDPGNRNRRLYYTGIAVPVLILGVYIISCFITFRGLEMAASENEDKSRKGIALLRSLGNENIVLKECYDQATLPLAYIYGNSNSDTVSNQQARIIYFKMTGQPFNSVPPPKMFNSFGRTADDWEFDSDVGGTAVNGIVKQLSMTSSRIDTKIEPDALTSYTEWTMVFTNSSADQREARAEIALPPGGVVSRLTLWVNGEEREAAFSTVGKVRQAYQEVAVVQRRDPVLVTTCGPDRVLMQCFPVPADGGTMKVRLGITAPLLPQSGDEALYILPRFAEQNFSSAEGLKHSLYAESSEGIGFAKITGRLIRMRITDSELAERHGIITCSHDPEVRSVWTPDMLQPDKYAIVQRFGKMQTQAPGHVVILIDGSRSTEDSREDIAKALKDLPQNCRFSVIHAGDRMQELVTMRQATNSALDEAAEKIMKMRCVGGADNGPALVEALGRAAKYNNAVVLWIHGTQPLKSNATTEQLIQLWERRPQSFRLLTYAISDGQNSILAELDKTGAVQVVPGVRGTSSDLAKLFKEWKDPHPAVERQRVLLSQASGRRVSSHLARLWARDEVLRTCRSADSRKSPEASRLAAKHQLVTPLSGAVVLENEEQYKQAGLKSVDPNSVPTLAVPEPATWVSLLAGTLGLIAARRRKHQADVDSHYS